MIKDLSIFYLISVNGAFLECFIRSQNLVRKTI